MVVSLNPIRPIAAHHILGSYHYAHPVFDAKAVAAQLQLSSMQGEHNTYYCGAWTGYGFHEDGLKSGQLVAQLLQSTLQQLVTDAHVQGDANATSDVTTEQAAHA